LADITLVSFTNSDICIERRSYFVETFLRLLLDESISPGRLRFLRANICEKRLHPTSGELRESYLTLPWPPRVVSETELAPGPDLSHEINSASLDNFLFGEPWLAVCTVQPPEGHILRPLFDKFCLALLSPPFPLPFLAVRRKKNGAGEEMAYFVTILPKTLAEILIDCSVEFSATQLSEKPPVRFDDLANRKVTEAEFALSLPPDFHSMPIPSGCRTLSHLLASMLVSKNTQVSIPRIVPPRQRARIGWTDKPDNSAKPGGGGGAATIAISPTGVSQMWSALPRDNKYDQIDPVCRIIDMMSATRIDPEPTINARAWLIYQARWGYYFPGYRNGILAGFELLLKFGAVISSIFFTEHPSSTLIETSAENGAIKETPSPVRPEHASLLKYLADQRMWMAAYEVTPLAPQSRLLTEILHGLSPSTPIPEMK